MNLLEFTKAFANEFDTTPEEVFSPDVVFKELDEWSSLIALSIISMVDDEMNKQLTGAELRKVNTIKELYELIINK